MALPHLPYKVDVILSAALTGLSLGLVIAFIRIGTQLAIMGRHDTFNDNLRVAGIPVAHLNFNGSTGWEVALNQPAHFIIPAICMVGGIVAVLLWPKMKADRSGSSARAK